MHLKTLLRETVEQGASDLHLSVGLPPVFRIHGELYRKDMPALSRDDLQAMLFSMLTGEQRRHLEQNWDLDFSYGLQDLGRFRVNIYKDKGNYAAALRTVASKVPSLEDLGQPDIVREIAERDKGLVLVTGPTGSGKSTTLASMIDHLNSSYGLHILTVEDPIEFIHPNKKSIVHQRELGMDTRSFENALRAAMREDPDIILVGEMRDLETIKLALTAAETGHLVMGTLHTSSAMQTVDRLVDVFPPEQQMQIRVQLANSLLAVFCQALLPRKRNSADPYDRGGRALAQEIMVVTPAIANMIRESKTAQMYSAVQTGSQMGMVTMEASLRNLVHNGLVDEKDALQVSTRPEELRRLLGSS